MEVDQPEETQVLIQSTTSDDSPVEMKEEDLVEVDDNVVCISQSFTSESASDESSPGPATATTGSSVSSQSPEESNDTTTIISTVGNSPNQNQNKTNGIPSPIAPRGKRKLTEESRTFTRYEEMVDVIEKGKERLMEALVRDTSIVSDFDEGRKIIDDMMEKKSPVAVDCEGVNLGDRRSGKVTLVQLGDMNGNVFLFDVQEEPKLAEELKRLLESEDVIKVLHDCRSDSEGLNHQFKINLKRVFDTQVAHIVIRKGTKEYQKSDKNIGLDAVCKFYGGYPNPFKDNIKGVYRTDQSYWTNRPLNDVMISYAASDVLCLVPTVYKELNSLIVTEEDKKAFADACDAHINQLQDTHNKKGQNQNQQRHRNYRGGHGPGRYPNSRHPAPHHQNQNHGHGPPVDSDFPALPNPAAHNHNHGPPNRGYNNNRDRGGGRGRQYHNDYAQYHRPYGGGGRGRGANENY